MFHDSSAFTAAGTLNLWVQRHGEQHACILMQYIEVVKLSTHAMLQRLAIVPNCAPHHSICKLPKPATT